MKRLIVLAVLAFILSSACVVAESKLQITKVEITSGGETLLSTSSASGRFNAEAGDTLRVKVRLENNFAESTHTDITGITARATIEGLGNADATDQESALSIMANGERTVTFRLEIPEDASAYESYYLVVTAAGTDENNGAQEDEASYDIDVKRADNELDIDELDMEDVDCGEDGTLDIEVHNDGEDDLEDVQLTARIDDTGTVWKDMFDIDSGETRSKSRRLDLTGISGGTHTLTVTLTHDDDKEVEEDTDFRVEGCGSERRSYDYEFDEYYGETPRKEVITEPYRNPNRDLTFLFRPEAQPVELQMPPPVLKMPREPTQKESGFSVIVLALANIAVIAFILLLLNSIRNR
jgi:hypothetical protein